MSTDIAAGTYVDPAAGKITFKSYAEDWRKAQPHRPGTARAVEIRLRTHAYPAFGARPIAAIRTRELQGWVAGLDLAPRTARATFATVRTVFGAAVRDRVVPYNPCEGVKLPEVLREQVEPLTRDQVTALLEAIPERYYALVFVGVSTGLRPSELFGLEVRHIDFLRRTVGVDQQLQQQDQNEVYVGPPKTAKSYRTIPVPQAVTDTLAAHLTAYPARECLVPHGKPDGELRSSQFLFSTQRRAYITPRMFRPRVWDRAVKTARLGRTGMHMMRHTYASALISAGLSVKVVSARLGHANASETLNTYTHLFPDDADRTREAVADWLSAEAPHVCPQEGTNG